VVPITLADEGLDAVDGVEAKVVLLDQLGAALDGIAPHDPTRIATLGGECALSVAPFSALAHRYGDDLAIVWVDSHPGIGAPASAYPDSTPRPCIRSFGPDELRESSGALLEWLAATGCSRVAVHFDTVDSDEIVLGLGAVPGGLTNSQVRRLIADVSGAADVVGLTIAEFFPRQVMHLQQILDGFPLLSDH
jgi:arginase